MNGAGVRQNQMTQFVKRCVMVVVEDGMTGGEEDEKGGYVGLDELVQRGEMGRLRTQLPGDLEGAVDSSFGNEGCGEYGELLQLLDLVRREEEEGVAASGMGATATRYEDKYGRENGILVLSTSPMTALNVEERRAVLGISPTFLQAQYLDAGAEGGVPQAIMDVLASRMPRFPSARPKRSDRALAAGECRVCVVWLSKDDQSSSATRLTLASDIIQAVRRSDPEVFLSCVSTGVFARNVSPILPWVVQSSQVVRGNLNIATAETDCDWRTMVRASSCPHHIRIDRTHAFTPSQSLSGSAGLILPHQHLSEIAFLIGCTPKYGA